MIIIIIDLRLINVIIDYYIIIFFFFKSIILIDVQNNYNIRDLTTDVI